MTLNFLFILLSDEDFFIFFFVFMLLSGEQFINQFNIMQSSIFIIPIIIISIVVAAIIIILYKSDTFSNWYSSKTYGNIELKKSSFKEIKIQKELERLNYTCKYCKAKLEGPICEYCNRINFQI